MKRKLFKIQPLIWILLKRISSDPVRTQPTGSKHFFQNVNQDMAISPLNNLHSGPTLKHRQCVMLVKGD